MRNKDQIKNELEYLFTFGIDQDYIINRILEIIEEQKHENN